MCWVSPESKPLTGYIQPGVARGHARHVDGGQGVPAGVGLDHPLHQQTLAARTVLVETEEAKHRPPVSPSQQPGGEGWGEGEG